MSAGHLVIGYHGCDAVTRDALVSGRLSTLDPSRNKYDWLGPGVYFFENDPERALQFAVASHKNPDRFYTKQPIANPAVVGAVLRVRHWLDMTTQAGMTEFANAYEAFLETGAERPVNAKATDEDPDHILRFLDNAVFSYLHQLLEDRRVIDPNVMEYQVVRGAFRQGDEITPKSGFRRDSHIQLAVRDQSCIVGWFLPPGSALFPPEQYAKLEAELAAAKRRARKPRVLASPKGGAGS